MYLIQLISPNKPRPSAICCSILFYILFYFWFPTTSYQSVYVIRAYPKEEITVYRGRLFDVPVVWSLAASLLETADTIIRRLKGHVKKHYPYRVGHHFSTAQAP